MAVSSPSPTHLAKLHHKVKYSLIIWLLWRLLAMPLVMGFVVKQLSWTFWGWQLVLLLPALLCVRSLWHGKNAERLIWVALVLLIYLATVGSGLLNDSYQQAPTVVIMVAVLEFILLGWLLGLLLYFIKKLPAQHRL